MVEQIIQFLFFIVDKLGYLGLFIVMFLESLIAPIPSEAILPFAGNLAYQGKFSILPLIFITSLGSYVGTLPFYFLGTKVKKTTIFSLTKKYGKWVFITVSDIEKAFSSFDKYGNRIVFFGRFIPVVRTIISLPAGTAHMNFLRFSIYSYLGSFLWCGAQVLIGYFLKDNIQVFTNFLATYEKILFVIFGGIFVYIIGKRYLASRKAI